jgi:hypothetical protein
MVRIRILHVRRKLSELMRKKCTIPLELGAWRGPYHSHCPSRWCHCSQRRHRPFMPLGVQSCMRDKPPPLGVLMVLRPGRGSVPPPGQFGDGGPVPVPGQIGFGGGVGDRGGRPGGRWAGSGHGTGRKAAAENCAGNEPHFRPAGEVKKIVCENRGDSDKFIIL